MELRLDVIPTAPKFPKHLDPFLMTAKAHRTNDYWGRGLRPSTCVRTQILVWFGRTNNKERIPHLWLCSYSAPDCKLPEE
jgi:hypothetical protein